MVAFVTKSLSPCIFHRNKKRNLENIAAGDVELTGAELAEIDEILAKTPVKGGRYNDSVDAGRLRLWA